MKNQLLNILQSFALVAAFICCSFSLNAQTCPACPAGFTSEAVAIDFTLDDLFGNGAGISDDGNAILATAGADGAFGGSAYEAGPFSTTDLANICLSGDFEVITNQDLAANPITIEFRIENACGGFPCPWVDFYTQITAPGTYSIGGLLSAGNNNGMGFDPAMATQIVVALANFSGTPYSDDITIDYSNLAVSACIEDAPPPAGAMCPACPAGFIGEDIPVTYLGSFSDGSGNINDNGTSLVMNAGADGVFAGSENTIGALPTTDLASICLIGDFEVITNADLSAFPITLEFRLENTGFGFPPPWIDFNTVITAPGAYPLGGLLSTGTDPVNNGIAFDPSLPSQVVIALANFAGPAPDDITINYSNLAVQACVEDVVEPASCPACPAGFISEDVSVTYLGSFSDGSGNLNDNGTSIVMNAGADGVFGGSENTIGALSTTDFASICMIGDFEVVTNADLSAFPITLEFRLENSGFGFPAPWVDFNTVITAPGTYPIGGLLSTGTDPMNQGLPFNPALPAQLVVALANFNGPSPDQITINYSNLAVQACVEDVVEPPVTCPACPAGFTSEDVAIDFTLDDLFDNGAGITDDGNAITGVAGANNAFGGSAYEAGPVSTTDLANICLTGDFEIITNADLAANPITIEFRIENACGGFPCPWVDFYTQITAPGTYTLGGLLSTGNNNGMGFDPAQPMQIVVAFANFGTPLTDDITIDYSNFAVSACFEEPPLPSTCPACPAGFISQDISLTQLGGFNDGSGTMFDNGTEIVGLAGADNAFAGLPFQINGALPSTNLGDICMNGNFTVSTDADLAAFPITIEFRIENTGFGFPPPWIDFNMQITAPGQYNIGNLLSTGNNTGFDPTLPAQLIIAFANNTGQGPLPNDITIGYDQISLTACVPDVFMPAMCPACPDGFDTETIALTFNESFSDGSGGANDTGSSIAIAAGANNIFAGSTYLAGAIPTGDLSNICLIGDFEVVSNADLSAFPITLEYRIENTGFGFPAPWIDFYTTVNATGQYALGGTLSTGNDPFNNGIAFDPSLPSQVVVSFANFGNPIPDDITINYSNFALSACTPEVVEPAECAACVSACDVQQNIDLSTTFMATGVFADPFTEPVATFDGTNGTLTGFAGTQSWFAVAGYDNIPSLPTNEATDYCILVDIEVPPSAALPILVEFRLEDSSGAPGNNGVALIADQTITAPGTYTIGGNLSMTNNGTPFGFNGPFALALAIANFSGTPSAEDITVNFSNMQIVACAFDESDPDAQPASAACPECVGCTSSTSIAVGEAGPFSGGGSGTSFADEAVLFGASGDANFFTGATFSLDPLPANVDINDVCLAMNMNVETTAYPIVIEFRLENTGFPFPPPQIEFNTTVTANGPITLGGGLGAGNDPMNQGAAFDPALPYQIVLAYADFSGTPLTDDVTICYQMPEASACVEDLSVAGCAVLPDNCAACEGCSEPSEFPVGDLGPFNGGGVGSYANQTEMFGAAGDVDFFTGATAGVGNLPSTDLNDICIGADIEVVTNADLSAFPIIIEYRIENTGFGFPPPWLSFDQTITAPGTYSLGGNLSAGIDPLNNGIAFDPALATQLVIAFANNMPGASPLPDDITIFYSNLRVISCTPTTQVVGCTDPTACNYNADACEDDDTCILPSADCADPCAPVFGCTDATACNFDADACADDGSCEFTYPTCTDPCVPVFGCTDAAACNFDADACVDDGTCDLGNGDCTDPCNPVAGCTDASACNYNADACIDDGTCDDGNADCADPCNPIVGCTNPLACNFNPDACVDNGTCDTGNSGCADPCNPIFGCTNPDACNYDPTACFNDGTCDLGNPTCDDPCNVTMGCTNINACNYDPTACVDDGSCQVGDIACADPCNPVSGCTNPNACNFDAAACVDDGTCELGNTDCADPCNPVSGCTDATACNYNASACVDDGSCIATPTCNDDICAGDVEVVDPANPCNCIVLDAQVLGCTDANACNFNTLANCDDSSCNYTPPVGDINCE